MVKLTLVFHEANGRTLDDGYDFENIYEKELNKYGKRILVKILQHSTKRKL